MLVLSRRIDERIMIGNDIVITVLEIHNDHVRIGIDAPRSIDVHREEVYRLVKAANVAAAAEGDAHLDSLRNLAPDTTAGSESVARLKKPSPPAPARPAGKAPKSRPPRPGDGPAPRP